MFNFIHRIGRCNENTMKQKWKKILNQLTRNDVHDVLLSATMYGSSLRAGTAA